MLKFLLDCVTGKREREYRINELAVTALKLAMKRDELTQHIEKLGCVAGYMMGMQNMCVENDGTPEEAIDFRCMYVIIEESAHLAMSDVRNTEFTIEMLINQVDVLSLGRPERQI